MMKFVLFLALSFLAVDDDAIREAKEQFESEITVAAKKVILAYKGRIAELTKSGKQDEADRLRELMNEFGTKHNILEFTTVFKFHRDLKILLDKHATASEITTELNREKRYTEILKEIDKLLLRRRYKYRLVIEDIAGVGGKDYEITLDRHLGLKIPYLARQFITKVTVKLDKSRAEKLQPGDFVEISGVIDVQLNRSASPTKNYRNKRRKNCVPVFSFILPEYGDNPFGETPRFYSGSNKYVQVAFYDIKIKTVFRK